MTKNQITITINDKTHRFNVDDVEAIRALPWSERKQLIDLLENIKQAEYVKSADTNFSATASPVSKNQPNGTDQPIISTNKQQVIKPSKPASQTNAAKLDPEIKASEKDVDDLMTRLILEQKSSHRPVPEKAAVIKWVLLVFAVIIGLALVI